MVNVRVTAQLKTLVEQSAAQREEAEAVIIREALNEYFETHGTAILHPK
jgi:hypothetical protein